MTSQPANETFENERFVGGVFRIEVGHWTLMNAPDLIGRLPEAERGPFLADLKTFGQLSERAYLTTPTLDVPLQRKFPGLWSDVLEHRDDPEFFQEPHFTPARAAKVRVPLLHVGAWYDPFVMSSIGQYEMVSALGSRRGDPERPAAHRGAMAPWRLRQ